MPCSFTGNARMDPTSPPNARAKTYAAEHPACHSTGPLAGRSSTEGAKPAPSCPQDTSSSTEAGLLFAKPELFSDETQVSFRFPELSPTPST